MPLEPKTPLPLMERVDRVSQHIIRARLFLELWYYFEERDSRQKIIGVMESYNEFFRFTPHAYLVAYVIYITGAFDKRRDTISLHNLIKESEKKAFLSSGAKFSITQLMSEARPIAEKVNILRHKAFAHRSAHISYNAVFKLASVKPHQLLQLTDLGLKIANWLLEIHQLPAQYFTDLPREAAENMMRALATKK